MMDLKQQVKRLSKNSLFKTIYNKHKKRRQRNPDITLETTRINALKEYLKVLKDYEDNVSRPDMLEKENDYYILVAGTSMRDSEWKRMVETQKTKGVTEPDQLLNDKLRDYLLSHFTEDKGEHTKNKTVDLW